MGICVKKYAKGVLDMPIFLKIFLSCILFIVLFTIYGFVHLKQRKTKAEKVIESWYNSVNSLIALISDYSMIVSVIQKYDYLSNISIKKEEWNNFCTEKHIPDIVKNAVYLKSVSENIRKIISDIEKENNTLNDSVEEFEKKVYEKIKLIINKIKSISKNEDFNKKIDFIISGREKNNFDLKEFLECIVDVINDEREKNDLFNVNNESQKSIIDKTRELNNFVASIGINGDKKTQKTINACIEKLNDEKKNIPEFEKQVNDMIQECKTLLIACTIRVNKDGHWATLKKPDSWFCSFDDFYYLSADKSGKVSEIFGKTNIFFFAEKAVKTIETENGTQNKEYVRICAVGNSGQCSVDVGEHESLNCEGLGKLTIYAV